MNIITLLKLMLLKVNLRQLVVDEAREKYMFEDNQPSYQLNKQQDPFSFFCDMYAYCMGDDLKNLFNFVVRKIVNCEHCSKKNMLRESKIFHLLLRMNPKERMVYNFNDLFQNEYVIDNFRCDCGFKTTSAIVTYNFSNCILLKFNTIQDNQHFSIEVENFDENYILIPNDQSVNIFIVKSALIFIPTCKNNIKLGGHYVIWRRAFGGTGWLEISDSTSIYHENFIKGLKNVYLLFLEKKSVNT